MSGAGNRKVSFPVTVWYEPETGQIQIMRPTARGFQAGVSDDAGSAAGHPELYRALRQALQEEQTGFAEPPRNFN